MPEYKKNATSTPLLDAIGEADNPDSIIDPPLYVEEDEDKNIFSDDDEGGI